MRSRWPGLAASYIGAVVGGGFASGREMFQFFAAHGTQGLWGAALAGILFAAAGAIALRRIAVQGHRHCGALLRDVCGRWLGAALDGVATVGFLVALAAVVSAAGALGTLLLRWPRWAGSVSFAIPLAAVSLGGRAAYIRANLIAATGLIAAVGFLAAHAVGLWISGPVPPIAPRPAVGPPWALAAVLYVGYNLLLGIAGLCAAADDVGPRDAGWGGVLGGGILGLLTMALTFVLLSAGGSAGAPGELPLASAIAHPWWTSVVFPALLLLALWTTGAAAAQGLGQRLQPGRPGPTAAAAVAAALPIALLGLTILVGTAYPALGYAGLPLLIGLATVPWRPAAPSPPPVPRP